MYVREVSVDAIHIYDMGRRWSCCLFGIQGYVCRVWKVCTCMIVIPESGLLCPAYSHVSHRSKGLPWSCQLLFVFLQHSSHRLRFDRVKIRVGTFNRPSPSAQREEMVHKIRNNKFHLHQPIYHHDVDEILFKSYGPHGFADLGVVGILPIQ